LSGSKHGAINGGNERKEQGWNVPTQDVIPEKIMSSRTSDICWRPEHNHAAWVWVRHGQNTNYPFVAIFSAMYDMMLCVILENIFSSENRDCCLNQRYRCILHNSVHTRS
jgi:hypothetical protein